jgi:hypothetical protein
MEEIKIMFTCANCPYRERCEKGELVLECPEVDVFEDEEEEEKE